MSKDDKKKPGGGGAARGGSLLLLGVVLFLVSWFVPVYKGQDVLGGLGNLAKDLGASPDAFGKSLQGPDWLPGWPACKFAWQLLLDEPAPNTPKVQLQDAWKQRVLGATCLTNAMMALAILIALAGRRSIALGFLLLADAGLNATWLWIPEQNPLEWLRAGYFLWLVSFVLVGIGLCGRRS